MDFMGRPENIVVTVLASGKVSSFSKTWYKLNPRFEGSSISAIIDEKTVGTVDDNRSAEGMIGIGCGWHGAQCDNLLISAPK